VRRARRRPRAGAAPAGRRPRPRAHGGRHAPALRRFPGWSVRRRRTPAPAAVAPRSADPARAPPRVQSTRMKRALQYGHSALPPSASIGRYTRGWEFHSVIDGSGQLSGRSARRTWYSRSALAGRGWVWLAVMSARGGVSRDILARKRRRAARQGPRRRACGRSGGRAGGLRVLGHHGLGGDADLDLVADVGREHADAEVAALDRGGGVESGGRAL